MSRKIYGNLIKAIHFVDNLVVQPNGKLERRVRGKEEWEEVGDERKGWGSLS